mgnify:CR=1 FL=1
MSAMKEYLMDQTENFLKHLLTFYVHGNIINMYIESR